MIFSQTKIADFKWEKRLLIVSGASELIVTQLKAEKAGLEERDLQVFVLSGWGEKEFPVNPKLADEFESRLSPPEAVPMVYLIGKDGITAKSWMMKEFTFQKLFASIDSMPMRQREMRDGK
ncbi:MAG: DUF4174 domain-containing protein [Armatimonadetes bacterium]|nr:DUF4174 domain-containing protein [Akkermansiaceae bacterium]